LIWIAIVVGVGVLVLLYLAMRKGSPNGGGRGQEGPPWEQSDAAVPSITITTRTIAPDPKEWEREREERKRVRETAIAKLRTEFVSPRTMEDAIDCVRQALAELARARSVPEPDTRAILSEARGAGTPAKMELAVRKRQNAAYKLRADRAKLHEALACCLVQVQLLLEQPDATWKVEAAVKRLVSNLDHEHYRKAAIGFLLLVGNALREARPDVAATCEDEAAQLFSNWWSDDNARARFQTDLAQVESVTSASDKHFLINGLVEYLNRRRRFDPSIRAQLVDLCERDVALYRTFLANFHRAGGQRLSFAQAVQSERYMCPSLPSFNILWDLFEEERDVRQLRRLQKLSKEIRYRDFEIDEELEASAPTAAAPRAERLPAAVAPPQAETSVRAGPEVPTEVIEAGKSGQTGKLSFLTTTGEPCSTEEAAADYFRVRGWRTLRAEVRFWQAMFASRSGRKSSRGATRRTRSATSRWTFSRARRSTRPAVLRSTRGLQPSPDRTSGNWWPPSFVGTDPPGRASCTTIRATISPTAASWRAPTPVTSSRSSRPPRSPRSSTGSRATRASTVRALPTT
jgi:hypothetical protein